MRRTLVLNAGYEPLQVVSWRRAMGLIFSSKAEVVSEYSETVSTISTSYTLPSVIRLNRYIRRSKRFGFVSCSRKNVLLRDKYQCQYCGVYCKPSATTIDHVIPKSKGGDSSWENLVTACAHCNRKKGNKLLPDLGMNLIRKPRRPGWNDLVKDSQKEISDDWMTYIEYIS